MFQKHPMSFGQGKRCLFQMYFIEQGDCRHRMSGRHPMSNQNEFRLGKRNQFCDYNISCGANDYSPPVLAYSNLYPVFCKGERTTRPYNFPDIGCFKNIRCLSAWLSPIISIAFDRTRGFPDIGCLPDIRCLTVMNSVWQTKSVLRL